MCGDMWVRRIGKIGASNHVVIPSAALDALGWKRGDYVRVILNDERSVLIERFVPELVTDRERLAAEPLPVVYA